MNIRKIHEQLGIDNQPFSIRKIHENIAYEQAQAKAQREWDETWKYATTPIETTPSAYELNTLGYKNQVTFNPVYVEGTEVPEGAKVVTQEQFDAINEARGKIRQYYTSGAYDAEKEYKAAKKAREEYENKWFLDPSKILESEFMAGDSGVDVRTRENLKQAAEKYYQLKYNTDADLTSIYNSLADKGGNEDSEAMKKALYGNTDIDDYIVGHVFGGLGARSSGITDTLDAVIGTPLKWVGWENNPISEWNKATQEATARLQQKGADVGYAWGDKENWGRIIQGVAGVAPDAVLAVMTGGLSEGFTTAGLRNAARIGTASARNAALKKILVQEGFPSPLATVAAKSKSISNAIGTTVKNLAKSPLYWSSFTQSFGNDFAQAKENGASDAAAYTYALINSTAVSLVEQGGIQVLPSKLMNKSKSQLLKWAVSAIEEGEEEVIQGLITEMNSKVSHAPDKTLGEIFDPARMLEEFAMGTAIGGIAGGGQVIASNIANTTPKTAKIQKQPEYKGIKELSAAPDKKDAFQKAMEKAGGYETLSKDQKSLKTLGQVVGVKVKFANLDVKREDGSIFSPDGSYDKTTNTITLNTSEAVKHNPVAFVLKHEITHSIENLAPERYADLASSILNSNLFRDWVQAEKGFETVEEYRADIMRRYTEQGVKGFEGQEGQVNASKEMVANFVGDVLFGGREDIAAKLINGMAPKQKKTFIEWVKDIFKTLRQKFSGNVTMAQEIDRLENLFLDAARETKSVRQNKSAQTETIAEEKTETEKTPEKDKTEIKEEAKPEKEVEQTSKDGGGKNVDKQDGKAYSIYDEYATQIMIWSNSANTKVGDVKVFNTRNGFVLLEATDDGYIELARGNYKEVKTEYERAYNNATDEIYGNFESYGSDKGRDIWSLQSDENRRNALGNNAETKGNRFQNNTSGNNENLRRGNKGKQSVKYSLPAIDSAYLEAVERGDMETAQRLVDEAAKAAGYIPATRYHQTGKVFTRFSNKNPDAALNDSDTPNGYFFKDNDHDIGVGDDYVKTGRGGRIQMPVFLKHNNLLYFKNREDAQKWYSSNIEGYDKLLKRYNEYVDEYKRIDKENTDRMFDELNALVEKGEDTPDNELAILDKYDKIIDKWILNNEAYETSLRKQMRHLLNEYFIENDSGYDGIELADDGHRYIDGKREDVHTYIVFKNTQIKSADPVTYDDKGNVIPLSQRFKADNDDIRYSLPESDRIPVGSKVRAGDRGNIGTVTYYNETLGEYTVSFTSKKGATASKTFPVSMLTPLGVSSTKGKSRSTASRVSAKNLIEKYDRGEITQDEVVNQLRESTLMNPVEIANLTPEDADTTPDLKPKEDRSIAPVQALARKKLGVEGGDRIAAMIEDFGGQPRSDLIDVANNILENLPDKPDTRKKEDKLLLARRIRETEESLNRAIKKVKKDYGTRKSWESFSESDIITDEVKDLIAKDGYIQNYGRTTNKRTLGKALELLEEEGRERVEKFMKMPPEEANAVDVAVGLILLERYQRARKFTSAQAVAQKLSEIGTISGQTVQIFSVIGRFSPEMMVQYAQRELDKAFEILVENKTKAWIDKHAEEFQLTPEDIDFIKNCTIVASQLEDGSRMKAVLLAQASQRVSDKIPPSAGDSIRAFQRISLLLNFRTFGRNLLGNVSMIPAYVSSDFFGNLIDKQLAKKSNIRTTGNVRFGDKDLGRAFWKGAVESWDDFKRGIRTRQEELNRFDVNVKQGKAFNENHEKLKILNGFSRAANALDNFTSFTLELGDRPFFEMWLVNSLKNQMALNKTDTPTAEMLEIAKQEALQRTWQDNNRFTRSLMGFKEKMNDFIHIPGTNYGLGDVVLKFVKTPANIAKAIIDFSPIGGIKAIANARRYMIALEKGNLTPAMQKEFVRTASNAITGSLLYILVAVLASVGAIELSGAGDEDKDVANFEKYVAGVHPYSMKIGGVWVPYEWNQPIGAVLAAVADIMDNADYEHEGWEDYANDAWNAMKAAGTVFTQQSFLQNLEELFAQDGIVEGFVSVGASEPSVFIPQLLSQIASFTDPYRRTTYDSNIFTTILNSAMNRIPGLRQMLPEQVNVLGEEAENTQFLNPWLAFASPYNLYPKVSGEVATELYELYKDTSDNGVIPPVVQNSFTVKGVEVTFTPEEKADFQKKVGKLSADILEEMFDSDEYKKLDDEQKTKAVKAVYSYATDKAKTELDIFDYDLVKEMEGKKSNGDYVLTKDKWNRIGRKGQQILIDEYFLTKKQRATKGDTKKLAEMFIESAADK